MTTATHQVDFSSDFQTIGSMCCNDPGDRGGI